MPTQARAAIMRAPHEPMTIETITIQDPAPGEVLIEVKATGLCASDLHVLEGTLPTPLPAILGHEAAGIVLQCGPGVTSLVPGDHVIPLFCPECRHCRNCTSGKTNICEQRGIVGTSDRIFLGNTPVARIGGLGTFASHALIDEIALTKVRTDAPFDRIFYIGCGVTTGVGSAVFTAKVTPGSSVIVFGAGGVGLNVLQGARLCGATKIIAVDTNPSRAEIALKFGATEFINPKEIEGDIVEHLRGLTNGGADFTFECVGITALMRQAIEAAHPCWGNSTVVGAAAWGSEVSLNPFEMLSGRSWRGAFFGGARGRSDVPKIVDWYMEGKLNIDDLVTHRLKLEDINKGFEMLKRGESIRSVITF